MEKWTRRMMGRSQGGAKDEDEGSMAEGRKDAWK